MYRKGTTLVRKIVYDDKVNKERQVIIPIHVDMIHESFWKQNSEILTMKAPLTLFDEEVKHLPDVVAEQLRM